MKVNYSNLLTKFAGIAGVTSASLLIGLPVGANDALNSQHSVFQGNPYSRTLSAPASAPKGKTLSQKNLAQNTGQGPLNPRPSILDECPYNRAACPGSTPAVPPTTPETTPAPAPAPGVETTPTQPSTGTEGKDLVALAESNKEFTMLTKALKAAGLTETLQGKGPFTVFAPTDAAFAKLPPDAVQDLLKPENKEVLVKILTYHVVSGQVLSTDLKSGEVNSVEGSPITVKADGGKSVMVNDANVVKPDIKGSNGVIHAIDQVILPPNL
ncbi:fasciclin domain-containing protein [Chlorogloeopsis sp. ULAP02]|uniref:fasciclin domain-containing protein n=1 Tax=Chlorogloeopsis sp. ULAP02 TaxID=3107926 RepID=UPI003135BBB8